MTYFGNDVWMINVLDFSDKVKTEAKGIFGQNENKNKHKKHKSHNIII